VLLPRQIVSTVRGMRKYSSVRASAKLLGGITQTSALMSTKLFSSKFFGSTTVEMLVKTLNSRAQRMSYP
jgi:hypothetical protein